MSPENLLLSWHPSQSQPTLIISTPKPATRVLGLSASREGCSDLAALGRRQVTNQLDLHLHPLPPTKINQGFDSVLTLRQVGVAASLASACQLGARGGCSLWRPAVLVGGRRPGGAGRASGPRSAGPPPPPPATTTGLGFYPQDPTVGLCLGSWGVPRGAGVFLWARYPCTAPLGRRDTDQLGLHFYPLPPTIFGTLTLIS